MSFSKSGGWGKPKTGQPMPDMETKPDTTAVVTSAGEPKTAPDEAGEMQFITATPTRQPETPRAAASGPKVPTDKENENEQLRNKIHRRLIEEIDTRSLKDVDPADLRKLVKQAVNELLMEENALLTQAERDRLVEDILDETMGLGPLENLIRDESISEVMVNGPKQIYVERKGKVVLSEVQFKDDEHLMQIIDRIVSAVGRRVDESAPLCDARLKDGSRVNVVIPPLALNGPTITIRKFSKDPYKIQDLINFGSLSPMAAELLKACVYSRLNIIIAGGTGSGKTTLLNVTSSFIPHDERIVTIEDSAELQLQQEHVVSLETRPANIEGKGEITMRDLVKNSLRMRPERIVVGEVRSGEALDMLQAMNTGHDGSLTTVHANTPRDAIRRLETLVMMAGFDLPQRAIREQIASAVDLIIQASRLHDGSRKVTSITEIVGMEGETVLLQEIFAFKQYGVGEDGKVIGEFKYTGVRPKCMERLLASGADIDPNLFNTL